MSTEQLRVLMKEIYQIISKLNPEFIYFTHKNMSYSLRKGPTHGLPKTHTFYYSKNAILFRDSLIWNNLPAVVKITLKILEILIVDV